MTAIYIDEEASVRFAALLADFMARNGGQTAYSGCGRMHAVISRKM